MRKLWITAILLIAVLSTLVACASPAMSPTVPAQSPAPTQQAPTTPKTTPPPTQAPTQTTPPAVGFSRGNPLPVEKSLITPEGIEITVLNLTKGDQAWEIIQKANQFNDSPANGMQYALITVKVKNISSQKEPWAFTDSYYELVGSSNKIFHTYDKSAVLPKEGILSKLKAELYHGGEAAGSLCFYIPQNESDLVLTWRGLTDTSRRFFEVKAVAIPTPTPTQTPTLTPTPTPTPSAKPTVITSQAELMSFLSTNFSSLETSLGVTKFTFEVEYNETINYPYDYKIMVDYDGSFIYDLKYSNKISTELANKVADELRAHQEKLARAVITLMPKTKLVGGYYAWGYEYPSIHVGRYTITYCSWSNLGSATWQTKYADAKITDFIWTPDSLLWPGQKDGQLGR